MRSGRNLWRLWRRFPVLILLMLTIGCKPDLVVDDVGVQWDATSKRVKALITNRGEADAGEFLVYFTPRECPVSSNYRPQTRHTVQSLPRGESITLESDFAPLARAENAHLANVLAVTVTADPKNLIGEKREDNNERTTPLYDISGLQNVAYNEGLGTILRGIVIDSGDSRNLDIAPGYYRVGQFRLWTQPDEKAVTLSIKKAYAEMATGPSILPQRNEEWVFSIVDEDDYDQSGWNLKARDFYGHTLAFKIEFAQNCVNVPSARLDCVDVALSTQNLSGQLSTCGWNSEPEWTMP